MQRRTFLKNSAIGIGALATMHGVRLKGAGRDAALKMTITAASGARHTLTAMGATQSVPKNYSGLPLDSRLDMARMIWGKDGLGFRACKLWSDPRWAPTGARLLSSYKKLYDDVNSVQPKMIWLYGSVGNPLAEGFDAYVARHAQMIADCKADGMVFPYTTTDNEPDDPTSHAHYPPTRAAELVKDFRRELDKRGLQDVKIVSPECANVDNGGIKYVQNIVDDPVALADVSVFAMHSANMSYTPAYYDLTNVPGKESWQTEGDANGPQSFNDAGLAAKFAAKACNDINFGANVWMHFLAYDSYDPNDNATRIMGYDPNTGNHQPFLVYYYYKQLRRAFQDGCVLRRSTSSDTRERVYHEMCFTYGDKPAIIGSAGRNSDGSWGLNVVNLTSQPDWLPKWRPPVPPDEAIFQPAATYNITYHVAELANAGTVRFSLYRSSSTVRDAYQGSVIMSNGDVTFTIAPMELVTLVSDPPRIPLI